MIEQYRLAALNAREAGFEGVELHCTSGYLPMQFMASGSNQRSDAYGGAVANRVRFPARCWPRWQRQSARGVWGSACAW